MNRLILLVLTVALSVLPLCGLAQSPAFYAKEGPDSLRLSAVPGEYFFFQGVAAVKADDYRHAVQMYKIAASWAYKKAEYNLGVIYLNGEGGVHQDMAQALAWMTLAAEREDGSNEHKMYATTLERVKKACDDDDREKAEAYLKLLSPEYGDEHALPRAKARWIQVRRGATGSHLGFVGNMQVSNSAAPSHGKVLDGRLSAPSGMYSAGEMTGGAGTDGTIAYRELQSTDNPYDVHFSVGTVTVGSVEAAGAPAKTDVQKEPEKP